MTTLRLYRRATIDTPVLGPAPRAIVWVQGCRRSCPGCISPEARDPAGGTAIAIDTVVEWLLQLPTPLEGVTFSGGEPFDQAAALRDLVARVRTHRDLGVVVYTGYTLDELRSGGDPTHLAWLAEGIDLLIDGPYCEEQHADLRWRGSRNQRLLPLTDRYRPQLAACADPADDHTAGLECLVEPDGSVLIVGIPSRPGFRPQFDRWWTESGSSRAPAPAPAADLPNDPTDET